MELHISQIIFEFNTNGDLKQYSFKTVQAFGECPLLCPVRGQEDVLAGHGRLKRPAPTWLCKPPASQCTWQAENLSPRPQVLLSVSPSPLSILQRCTMQPRRDSGRSLGEVQVGAARQWAARRDGAGDTCW